MQNAFLHLLLFFQLLHTITIIMTYFPYAKKSFYSIRSTKFKFGPNKLKIKIMDRTHLSMEIKQKIIALRNYSSKTFSEIAAECECSVSNFLGRNFI